MQWSIVLDPVNSGDVCEIGIVNFEEIVLLEDVMFGDVWFCSGQSNMGWAMLGNKNVKKYNIEIFHI